MTDKTEGRRLGGFFFQAEDGIRDGTVTGVQTCALPIFDYAKLATRWLDLLTRRADRRVIIAVDWTERSEERRVGKSVDLGGRRMIKKKRRRPCSGVGPLRTV